MTTATPDVRQQHEQLQAEATQLEQRLTELAANGRTDEMADVAAQLEAKRSEISRSAIVVGKLDEAAAAAQAEEQERERRAEAERERQAQAKLEADFAAVDDELTTLYVEAENEIVRLQHTIIKIAAVAGRFGPLAQQLGRQPVGGSWAVELLRPVFYRARFLLRREADLNIQGLSKALFIDDGTTLGSEPLVKEIEGPSAGVAIS